MKTLQKIHVGNCIAYTRKASYCETEKNCTGNVTCSHAGLPSQQLLEK